MNGYLCSRFFYSIDGNLIRASQAVGYCRWKQGMVTKPQRDTHNCLCKVNGAMCNKYIEFEYEDQFDESMSMPTGEAYQKYLKSKKKR